MGAEMSDGWNGSYIVGELTRLDETNSDPCPRCGERVGHGERICAVCATRAVMAAIERGDCTTITESEIALRISAGGDVSVVEFDGGEA